MSESLPVARCPACGAAMPARAPEGLCPKCLFLEAAGRTEAGAGRERPVAPALDAVAAAFPQLEILELIGQGGMGCVFKARQPQLNRFVALKILPEALACDPAFASRFTREAQALASLSHPSIVTIHDFGQANGFFHLLMEFVDGVNLRQALRAGRFTPEQALAIVPPICDALQFAHERGIVHRDIKPENLLLDKSGHVKIADFGIAKMLGGEGEQPWSETRPQHAGESKAAATGPADTTAVQHTAAGTPQYMAPEQRHNPQRADHRADIYSLGVVLYELLTGELPGAKLQPPSKKVQIDVRLDEVVLRALEVKPELRYATAAEFRTQLESVPVGATTPAAATPAFGAADPWLAPAISLVLYFAGMVAGIPIVDALPVYKHSAYLLVAALMFCVAPVVGILTANSLRRRLASDDEAINGSARAWLKGLGWVALVLAIPVIGFGSFFLLALLNQRGHWNPAPSEAILVPLAWFGSILLPLAGRRLLRASGTILKPTPVLTAPAANGPKFLAVSLFSVVGFGLALVVGWLTLGSSREAPKPLAVDFNAPRVNHERGANDLPQSKREQFVPQQGMANQTSWSVHPKPSFLNSNGWAVMARMTIGGVARIQFPGEAQRRCDITLLKGDDHGITVRIDDLARRSAMTLSLRRDQPGEITLDGEGYRVLYPTTEVAASEPGISPFAHVIVTQAEQQDATDQGQTVDSVPPVVVQAEPASGARDVAPGLTEIRVRFSKPMAEGAWSWTTAWRDSAPDIMEGPRYEADGRTCVIKASLKPGRTYAYWLNSSSHQNFKDRNGNPAVPYLLIFQTRSTEDSF